MYITFMFTDYNKEKVVGFTKEKLGKTWNEFMDWFVETHPYYEVFKKAYLKKVNEEKAPWERKEEV